MLGHVVDPLKEDLRFYLLNDEGQHYGSINALRDALQGKGRRLTFAMNGGMYMENRMPLGLYIEDGDVIRDVNRTEHAHGNFYLQPNGVFLLKGDGTANIIPTKSYTSKSDISYATQSGPMLLIDGEIHPKLTRGSSNLHIRNGVGILPDGRILFAISKEHINFHDFANYFLEHGCKNALYLDGFVSRCYLPAIGRKQLDGDFGVIIGTSEPM